MGIGIRLKEILRNKKMTIKQLAEISGVPLNTLYSITKRDSSRIDKVVLRRISDTLGIDALELLGLESVDSSSTEGRVLSLCVSEEFSKLDGFLGLDENGFPQFRKGSLAESVFFGEGTGVEDDRYRWYKLNRAFAKLNADGQQKAVERMEELTEIPKYQRQTPHDATSTTEGKETASEKKTPLEAKEKAPEGE